MSLKTRATIEDLYKVEGKAELVDGEIVLLPPAGDEPGRASVHVVISLHDYEKRTGVGRVYGDGTGFHRHLPHREAFGPDAAYHVGPRTGMRFLEGAPILAVEDLSVNQMVHNHCLAKSIQDAAWSQFATFVSYKAAWAGRRIEV